MYFSHQAERVKARFDRHVVEEKIELQVIASLSSTLDITESLSSVECVTFLPSEDISEENKDKTCSQDDSEPVLSPNVDVNPADKHKRRRTRVWSHWR